MSDTVDNEQHTTIGVDGFKKDLILAESTCVTINNDFEHAKLVHWMTVHTNNKKIQMGTGYPWYLDVMNGIVVYNLDEYAVVLTYKEAEHRVMGAAINNSPVNYLLDCLIEESSEVIKECAKSLRFGTHGVNPYLEPYEFNVDRIKDELADVRIIAEQLEELMFIPKQTDAEYETHREAKLGRIWYYYHKEYMGNGNESR